MSFQGVLPYERTACLHHINHDGGDIICAAAVQRNLDQPVTDSFQRCAAQHILKDREGGVFGQPVGADQKAVARLCIPADLIDLQVLPTPTARVMALDCGCWSASSQVILPAKTYSATAE